MSVMTQHNDISICRADEFAFYSTCPINRNRLYHVSSSLVGQRETREDTRLQNRLLHFIILLSHGASILTQDHHSLPIHSASTLQTVRPLFNP